jgi:hypothetical protein
VNHKSNLQGIPFRRPDPLQTRLPQCAVSRFQINDLGFLHGRLSQLGEFVVVCLWHDGLKQKDRKLYYQLDRSRWRAKSTDTRRIEFLQHRKHRLDRARHWQHKQAGKRSG